MLYYHKKKGSMYRKISAQRNVSFLLFKTQYKNKNVKEHLIKPHFSLKMPLQSFYTSRGFHQSSTRQDKLQRILRKTSREKIKISHKSFILRKNFLTLPSFVMIQSKPQDIMHLSVFEISAC